MFLFSFVQGNLKLHLPGGALWERQRAFRDVGTRASWIWSWKTSYVGMKRERENVCSLHKTISAGLLALRRSSRWLNSPVTSAPWRREKHSWCRRPKCVSSVVWWWRWACVCVEGVRVCAGLRVCVWREEIGVFASSACSFCHPAKLLFKLRNVIAPKYPHLLTVFISSAHNHKHQNV